MRAVVLGGGGIAGIAWGCGYLHGLEEAGIVLRSADQVIGTSAGSVAGAWLTGEKPLSERFAYVMNADRPLQRALGRLAHGLSSRESPVRDRALALLFEEDAGDARRLGELGRLACEARTMPEPMFVGFLATLVGRAAWTSDALRTTAYDTSSGRRVVVGERDGVRLARACAASSAVPGVFPPIRVREQRLMDGGCESATNADLAGEARSVVCLSLMARDAGAPPTMLAEVAELEKAGARVHSSWPNETAVEAAGADLLDPAAAPRLAEAGRAQAQAEAEAAARVWEG